MSAPFSTQAFRLAAGGRIDRSRTLAFRFDGREMTGHPGDTLASALLANGVHLVGRSYKYHRPRGILSAGAEEPNALVNVSRGGNRSAPNLRATQVELYDGLAATSQNAWPTLGFDLGAVNDYAPSGLLGAGFYYKTFMPSLAAWKHLFEPVVRYAAGLGRAPKGEDPDRYAQRHAHCDVLVIGAGAAGLAAALAAAEEGASVILCDEQAEMGGGLLSELRSTRIEGQRPAEWAEAVVAKLTNHGRVTLLSRTTAFGYYAQNFVALAERLTDHLAAPHPDAPRERLWKVRARAVVLATGAIERPLVFSDNDRPGVMLASAASAWVNRYGVKPGERALVVTREDSGYAAAFALHAAGVEVAAIADTRIFPKEAGERARAAGLPVIASATLLGTEGRRRITEAQLGFVTRSGQVRAGEAVPCDCLVMAGGWTPSLHLSSQSRAKPRFDETRSLFLPGEPAQAERSAGACRGVFGLAACIEDGYAAGEQAAKSALNQTGKSPIQPASPARQPIQVIHEFVPTDATLGPLSHLKLPHKVKSFVDFQNDVTEKDLGLAVREGFSSIEHVKRYTTTGMATDQGKTSNLNALAIVAGARGASIPEVGLTTFRPPYTPVTFGLFAGRARGPDYDPVRRTPTHDWATEHGAVFEDTGLWKRVNHFPQPGETMTRAVARECRAVRERVGLFDASTLGKIEIVGPDAAEFLNRLYVNSFTKLEPGRCRYGLMLTEAGFVMDDGVVGRLAADRFHVTTTSGGAARVLGAMEDYLQTEFTDLRVWLTSVTEQWAVIAVQGPKARAVIAPLVEGVDLSPEAMPHMSVREGRILGVPMRLFRMSFSGELGYEINVPADHGQALWQAVFEAGQPHGVTPYGLEAMHILRAEKGYVVVGQETDGTVTPDDLGLAGMIGKAKPDFIGKRSLAMADLVAPGRKQLVGLLTDDPRTVLEEGAQITATATPAAGEGALGHVTSAYASPTLNRAIALALVKDGRARIGQTIFVPMARGAIAARIVSPVFHDPDGARLHG